MSDFQQFSYGELIQLQTEANKYLQALTKDAENNKQADLQKLQLAIAIEQDKELKTLKTQISTLPIKFPILKF